MTTHFNAPLLNKVRQAGSREWFSNCPIQYDPDYSHLMWDFVNGSDYDSTNDWDELIDTSATVAVQAGKTNGELLLKGFSATNDVGACIQGKFNTFDFQDVTDIWWEARVKVSDATQMDMVAGFTGALATNPEEALQSSSRCCFQKDDGNASIICKTELSSTETSTDSGLDMSDDTYVKLGLHIKDSGTTVKFFVDRSLVATHTTNIPTGEQAIAMMALSGEGAGIKSLSIDYISVVSKRS